MSNKVSGIIFGCVLAIAWTQGAAAFTTSPLCRETFGYDQNGKKHCNLALWESQHRNAKKAGKKKR